MTTSPGVWIAVGFATAHVAWSLVLAVWFAWLTRGITSADRRAKIDRDFSDVRRAIREHTHRWN